MRISKWCRDREQLAKGFVEQGWAPRKKRRPSHRQTERVVLSWRRRPIQAPLMGGHRITVRDQIIVTVVRVQTRGSRSAERWGRRRNLDGVAHRVIGIICLIAARIDG